MIDIRFTIRSKGEIKIIKSALNLLLQSCGPEQMKKEMKIIELYKKVIYYESTRKISKTNKVKK